MSEPARESEALTQVLIETPYGSLLLGIDEQRAPLTAANFLAYVDRGFLAQASVYRIVTLDNQAPGSSHPIEVIQWGWPAPDAGLAPPLPPVPHEPTSQTGLRHRDGTLSLAATLQAAAGTASSSVTATSPNSMKAAAAIPTSPALPLSADCWPGPIRWPVSWPGQSQRNICSRRCRS